MTVAPDGVSVAATPLPTCDQASQQVDPAGGIAAGGSAGDAARDSMVSVPLYRARRGHGVGLTSSEPVPEPPAKPTVLARTLAFAHRLQKMLDEGRAKNRADLAAKLGFSRARITQIMNLLWLAPDIQEEILFSVSLAGRDAITTRDVRLIVRAVAWDEQRRLWQALRSSGDAE